MAARRGLGITSKDMVQTLTVCCVSWDSHLLQLLLLGGGSCTYVFNIVVTYQQLHQLPQTQQASSRLKGSRVSSGNMFCHAVPDIKGVHAGGIKAGVLLC
jgi:hypothetical protein